MGERMTKGTYAITSTGRELPILPGRVVLVEKGEEIVAIYEKQLAIVYTPAHDRLVGKDVCSVRIHLA